MVKNHEQPILSVLFYRLGDGGEGLIMYKQGFSEVDMDRRILTSSQLIDDISKSYAENIVKKEVVINENQIKYFEWYLEHRFRR